MNYVNLELEKYLEITQKIRELVTLNDEKDKRIDDLIKKNYSYVITKKNEYYGLNRSFGSKEYHFKEKAELIEEFLQKIQKQQDEIETLKKRKWYDLLFNIKN